MRRNWQLMKLGLPGMSHSHLAAFGSSKPSFRRSYMARFSLQGVPWMVSLDNTMGITLEELGAPHPDWHRCDSHSSILPKSDPTSISLRPLNSGC
jgi:hypothetical protein